MGCETSKSTDVCLCLVTGPVIGLNPVSSMQKSYCQLIKLTIPTVSNEKMTLYLCGIERTLLARRLPPTWQIDGRTSMFRSLLVASLVSCGGISVAIEII